MRGISCTLFVLPSFGGVGGGSRGLGEVSRGGRTTYLYLVKIKIHLMINSLVCVALPVLIHTREPHPNPSPKTYPQPLPKGGETKLAGYFIADIAQRHMFKT